MLRSLLLGTDEGAPRLARYIEAPAAACVLLAMTVVVFTVPPGVRAGQQIVVQTPNGQRVTVQLRVVQLPPRSQLPPDLRVKEMGLYGGLEHGRVEFDRASLPIRLRYNVDGCHGIP